MGEPVIGKGSEMLDQASRLVDATGDERLLSCAIDLQSSRPPQKLSVFSPFFFLLLSLVVGFVDLGAFPRLSGEGRC